MPPQSEELNKNCLEHEALQDYGAAEMMNLLRTNLLRSEKSSRLVIQGKSLGCTTVDSENLKVRPNWTPPDVNGKGRKPSIDIEREVKN